MVVLCGSGGRGEGDGAAEGFELTDVVAFLGVRVDVAGVGRGRGRWSGSRRTGARRWTSTPTASSRTSPDKLGILTHRVKTDMKNFKEFIESRGHETGAWRGNVERPDQVRLDEA